MVERGGRGIRLREREDRVRGEGKDSREGGERMMIVLRIDCSPHQALRNLTYIASVRMSLSANRWRGEGVQCP